MFFYFSRIQFPSSSTSKLSSKRSGQYFLIKSKSETTFCVACLSLCWKCHFCVAVFSAILKTVKHASLAALWPELWTFCPFATTTFKIMLLVASICSGYYKFVVKIKIAIALAARNPIFSFLRMAKKMAIRKWHFQSFDKHTTEKVKKVDTFPEKILSQSFWKKVNVKMECIFS